jgi:NADH-quinone oxidoreductase subunit E
MAQINDYYYEDLTPETLGQIIEDLRAGKDPKSGSYAGRQGSAPESGPKTLSDPKLYDGSAAKPIKIPNAPQPEPAE